MKKRVYKAAKSVVQHLVKAEAQDWPAAEHDTVKCSKDRKKGK